ncbi:Protein of unknown function [Propionibacterium freudenreichii]|nr:Protein of unknown function [Propionibacterium freudenreichii]
MVVRGEVFDANFDDERLSGIAKVLCADLRVELGGASSKRKIKATKQR